MLALEVRGLSKSFFGYPALSEVDLDVLPGEVHGLAGENGAGKSTLMKILAGVHAQDAGTVRLNGREVRFTHPVQAYAAGISTVFQEFNLIPGRTVAENIYLGREPRRSGFVARKVMNHNAQDLLGSLGVSSIRASTLVSDLSVAQQQIVEIAKALSYDARVISMDEPTAALADHEVELLHGIVKQLTARGVSVLYVSHRLRDLLGVCDRITVFKDGKLVTTRTASELTEHGLVRLMVGRSLSAFFPDKTEGTEAGDVVLSLHGAGNAYVDELNLELRRGEIVGIAGLQGSGRTEIMEGISGSAPFIRGDIRVEGQPVRISRPSHAIRLGIAHITEDRKGTGLVLGQSVMDNVLTVLRAMGVKHRSNVQGEANQLLRELELSARGPDQEIRYLSGGNQQKVVLAKWLLMKPRIILLDEPTRGIDVGAKHALYSLIRRLAFEGHAILMVSSELPEVIGICDRILVMHEGRLAAELPGGSAEETILEAASGLNLKTEVPA